MVCFSAAILNSHTDTIGQQLNERLFLAELKSVLPNVKDWEGGRKSREYGSQEQYENYEE